MATYVKSAKLQTAYSGGTGAYFVLDSLLVSADLSSLDSDAYELRAVAESPSDNSVSFVGQITRYGSGTYDFSYLGVAYNFYGKRVRYGACVVDRKTQAVVDGPVYDSRYVYNLPRQAPTASVTRTGARTALLTVHADDAAQGAPLSSSWVDRLYVRVSGGGSGRYHKVSTSPYGSDLVATLELDELKTQKNVIETVDLGLPDLNAYNGGADSYSPIPIRLGLKIAKVQAPLAPTIRPVVSPWPIEDKSFALSWVPNHPDLSAQSQAQVEWTSPSGSASTRTVTGPSATLSYGTFAETGTWKARVRTRGLSSAWGEWSSYATFVVGKTPAVALTVPRTVTALPASITWTSNLGSGEEASQSISIVGASSGTAYSSVLATGVRSLSLSTANVLLTNGDTYTVRLDARASSGLVGTATATFTVRWTPPGNPYVRVINSSKLSTMLIVSSGSGVAATSMSVVRVDPDGTRTSLGTVEPGGNVVDRLPPLNVDYAYEVTAMAASGATTTLPVANVVDSDGMEAYNFGPSAETEVSLGLDTSDSESIERGGETFHFALGAGTEPLPTFYPDGDMDVSGSKSYSVHGAEGYEALRRAVRGATGALCWYRDAWGHRAFGHASWQLSYSAQEHDLFKVSCDFTECVWEEPANG